MPRVTLRRMVALVAAGTLAWAPPLYAYVDPGAGGMLVQIIIAAVAGATYGLRDRLRGLWRSILRRMGRREPPTGDT